MAVKAGIQEDERAEAATVAVALEVVSEEAMVGGKGVGSPAAAASRGSRRRALGTALQPRDVPHPAQGPDGPSGTQCARRTCSRQPCC